MVARWQLLHTCQVENATTRPSSSSMCPHSRDAPLTLGMRPPHWDLHPKLYKARHSPSLQVSWSFGNKLFVYHCYYNTFSHIGIKEDFGGQIGGLAKCVDAYVYEVILFYCFLLLYFG